MEFLRSLFLGFLACVLPAISCPAQSPTLATNNYGCSSLPQELKTGAFAQWASAEFAWFQDCPVVGLQVSAYGDYADSAGIYLDQVYDLCDAVLGPRCDDSILTAKKNYQDAPQLVWTKAKMFDGFEHDGLHGAFLVCGSTATDKTQALWSGAGVQIPNGCFLHLGYGRPFARIDVALKVARVDGSVSFSYPTAKGYSTVKYLSDTTSGLAYSGTVHFMPSQDQVTKSIGGSRLKYWARIGVTGATIPPTVGKVTGDDWLARDAPNNMRGWSCPAANSFQVGPTWWCSAPVYGAEFKYQAWMSGLWAPQYLYYDVSKPDAATAMLLANFRGSWGKAAFNSTMLDNVGAVPSYTTPFDNGNWAWPCAPNCTSADGERYWHAYLAKFKPAFKAEHPGATVGGNAWPFVAYIPDLDYIALELSTTWDRIDTAAVYAKFDLCNSSAGARCVLGLWGDVWNTYKETQPDGSAFVPWTADGDRMPMLVFGAYMMGAGSKTLFNFNTTGWSYPASDEVPGFFGCSTTLASPIAAGAGQATFTVADLSCAKPIGAWWGQANYFVRVGQDVLQATKGGSTFTTSTGRYQAHAAGDKVEFSIVSHASDPNHPAYTVQNVHYWSVAFPAEQFDYGKPLEPRNTSFMTGTSISALPGGLSAGRYAPLWKRCFEAGCWLLRPTKDSTSILEYTAPSKAINLSSLEASCAPKCFYRRLRADGKQDIAPLQTLKLMGGEAAFLVRQNKPCLFCKGGGKVGR